MKKNKWYSSVGYTVVVLVTTIFIRLPLPSTGYFNFGDVAVVFSGLMLGKADGCIAGGVGSALADVLGGYFIFSPLTLIAKGSEGFFSGLANGKKGFLYWIFPVIGCSLMVIIYFVGEAVFYPQIKIAGALLELLPNIVQAAGGYIGGKLLFEIYNRINRNHDLPVINK